MAERSINICESGSDSGNFADITICPDQDSEEAKEIKICPGDCNNPPELDLSGEDAPVVGDTYSASGGEGVYNFSFDGGSIDSNGQILSVTSCGGSENGGAVGRVTVTDSCGQSAYIVVRLPGGTWVTVTSVTVCAGTGDEATRPYDAAQCYGYSDEDLVELFNTHTERPVTVFPSASVQHKISAVGSYPPICYYQFPCLGGTDTSSYWLTEDHWECV